MLLSELRSRTSQKWATHGSDVLPLFVAEMDFELAPPVKAALHEAIARSDTGYAHPKHFRSLFHAYARASFDWDVPHDRVFAVPDVMGGVAETLRLFTERGDGIVINAPVYPPFFETIGDVERRFVEVPLEGSIEAGWSLDFDALEHAFEKGARAYLFCHPHNPVGRAYVREELERVASLCARYNVMLISDEIHAALTYDGAKHIPMASIAETYGAKAVTLMSASKAWNIPGLKCAQLIAGSDEVRTVLERMPKDVVDRIGILGIVGTQAAYRDGALWLSETIAQLDANRKLLRDLLAEHLPEIRYRVPQATYLAWLDCTGLGLGDRPSDVFLERGRVALEPGVKFGKQGRGFARFNFGTTPEIIEEGVKRMKLAVSS